MNAWRIRSKRVVLIRFVKQSTENERKNVMRHGDGHRKFNMPKSQRRALFSNLTSALLEHEQLGKELRQNAAVYEDERSNNKSIIAKWVEAYKNIVLS